MRNAQRLHTLAYEVYDGHTATAMALVEKMTAEEAKALLGVALVEIADRWEARTNAA